MDDEKRILIFSACYNEKDNIKKLISGIRKNLPLCSILIVDDNSPDQTKEIVKKLQSKESQLYLVIREKKLGLDTAHKFAYNFALKNNYDYLIPMVTRKVKAIICLGKENKNLIDIFSKCTELIISTDNMSDAVNSAYRVSKPGDIVLLSPACSSFDLFESYEERGNKFKEEVRKL